MYLNSNIIFLQRLTYFQITKVIFHSASCEGDQKREAEERPREPPALDKRQKANGEDPEGQRGKATGENSIVKKVTRLHSGWRSVVIKTQAREGEMRGKGKREKGSDSTHSHIEAFDQMAYQMGIPYTAPMCVLKNSF